MSRPSLYTRSLKVLIDRLGAAVALLLLLPVLLLLALLVRMKLGSPVFFTQVRPGYQARPFRMVKFRTMTDERDTKGELLPDEVRLTPFGRFLRSTSLDELPELLNVLRGDMSLVGPRPLLMRYVERYSERQYRRHEVLPGVTGWAQVNGRNAIDWDTKFELDVYYVDHVSLSLDLRILFLTVWKMVRRDGISQPGHATAEEFMGSEGRGA